MPRLKPLTGAPDLVQVAEMIRQEILRDADDLDRELVRQSKNAPSDLQREADRQGERLERILVQTDAAWWLARRGKSLSELMQEGIYGPTAHDPPAWPGWPA